MRHRAPQPSALLVQVGYFSLLVDETLDSGMSRPAATYGSPCLASDETFDIACVECWRTLPAAALAGTQGKAAGTAMDRFGQDKFLLEMQGRTMHSDAYRAQRPDDAQ